MAWNLGIEGGEQDRLAASVARFAAHGGHRSLIP